MANKIYPFANLTGGVDDSYLDYTDGDNLTDGDFALGIDANGIHRAYRLNATSGATENSPYIIAPDTNPGTKRWELMAPGGAMTHIEYTKATAQSFPSGNTDTILYDTEVEDTLSEYNTTTGVFTATAAGTYHVSFALLTDNVTWLAGTPMDLVIKKNGTAYRKGSHIYLFAGVTTAFSVWLSASITLAASDTLEFCFHHVRTAAVDNETDATENWLTIDRLV